MIARLSIFADPSEHDSIITAFSNAGISVTRRLGSDNMLHLTLSGSPGAMCDAAGWLERYYGDDPYHDLMEQIEAATRDKPTDMAYVLYIFSLFDSEMLMSIHRTLEGAQRKVEGPWSEQYSVSDGPFWAAERDECSEYRIMARMLED